MGAIDGKVFKSGDGVAVRLPEALAFAADTRVTIERSGDVITIRLTGDPAAEKAKPLDLVEALRALPAVDEDTGREPIEFPDRPSLY